MWTNARMVTIDAAAFNFLRCGFLLSAGTRSADTFGLLQLVLCHRYLRGAELDMTRSVFPTASMITSRSFVGRFRVD